MKKTKQQKGITLIALIITIVVLLILAAVAISSITNDGILSYAQNAAKDYNQAVKDEQDMLDEYLEFLEGSVKIVDKDGNDLRNKTVDVNTEVYDKYGNKIVIPEGFKIRVDDTTNNADTVTEGIVIEDEDGNQFVWIPVGKIYTDTAKTEANAKTITLGRYDFDLTTGEASAYSGSEYIEETKTETGLGQYGNAIARDIEAFKISATTNCGYYFGRYEARKNENGDLTTISTNIVYSGVNQITASDLAQEMYGDGYLTGTFSSDLINSYAWDTSIVFLQTFDNRKDKTISYSNQNSLNTTIETLGTKVDIICNIYDMASNYFEYSTTTGLIIEEQPCVRRGCSAINENDRTAARWGLKVTDNNVNISFRPILYLAL